VFSNLGEALSKVCTSLLAFVGARIGASLIVAFIAVLETFIAHSIVALFITVEVSGMKEHSSIHDAVAKVSALFLAPFAARIGATLITVAIHTVLLLGALPALSIIASSIVAHRTGKFHDGLLSLFLFHVLLHSLAFLLILLCHGEIPDAVC